MKNKNNILIIVGIFVVLTLLMAPAMGMNGPGHEEAAQEEDMSIADENCSSCHRQLPTNLSYVNGHHRDEVLEQLGCMDCHSWVVEKTYFRLIPECGLCHTGGQRDHHPLEGNNCSLCHGDSAMGARGTGSGQSHTVVVHSDEMIVCSDCHSVGNQGSNINQNDEGGSQYRCGR